MVQGQNAERGGCGGGAAAGSRSNSGRQGVREQQSSAHCECPVANVLTVGVQSSESSAGRFQQCGLPRLQSSHLSFKARLNWKWVGQEKQQDGRQATRTDNTPQWQVAEICVQGQMSPLSCPTSTPHTQ